MSEGRRLVAFDQEMACPGESVTYYWPAQSVNWMPQSECPYHHRQPQKSSQSVHDAITPVAVFRQVKSKKLFVTGKYVL